MKPDLYFVALVLSEPAQSEITGFKFYLQKKYVWKVALKSPAHITLIPPFHLTEISEEILLQHLQFFKSDLQQIKIELNGFNHFGQRTIYVSVHQNELLNELHSGLNLHFNNLAISKLSTKINSPVKTFHPHVTIANRDICINQFEEAWNYFKKKEFKTDSIENRFSLLKHDGNYWQVIRDFQL